jgi:hypothetical protein
MSKRINDPEQIAAEIDNQGFGYWIQNYGESSLKEQGADELAELAKQTCELMNKLEKELIAQKAYWI